LCPGSDQGKRNLTSGFTPFLGSLTSAHMGPLRALPAPDSPPLPPIRPRKLYRDCYPRGYSCWALRRLVGRLGPAVVGPERPDPSAPVGLSLRTSDSGCPEPPHPRALGGTKGAPCQHNALRPLLRLASGPASAGTPYDGGSPAASCPPSCQDGES
jgi:hypothetical protein